MDTSMIVPLVIMVIGTKLWFIGALLARARADNLRREAGKAWVAELAMPGSRARTGGARP
jgi:heme exporter protein C